MIPENIQKLGEELESVRTDVAEKQKELAASIRKERALANKVEAAWQQQHEKIINTIKGITG